MNLRRSPRPFNSRHMIADSPRRALPRRNGFLAFLRERGFDAEAGTFPRRSSSSAFSVSLAASFRAPPLVMRIHSTWSENCITIYPARIRKAMPSLQRRRRVRRGRWRNSGRRNPSKSRREFMTAVASKRTLGILKLASWAFHCRRGQIRHRPVQLYENRCRT